MLLQMALKEDMEQMIYMENPQTPQKKIVPTPGYTAQLSELAVTNQLLLDIP